MVLFLKRFHKCPLMNRTKGQKIKREKDFLLYNSIPLNHRLKYLQSLLQFLL